MSSAEHGATKTWEPTDVSRDRLNAHFAQTDFAQRILKQLQLEGYVVLPGVFSTEETEVELARAWDFVETVSPSVNRANPSSWWKATDGGLDPWPSAQRDMMHKHQAGWVFSDLRERFAERVYERMYGTRRLHCSKDGFTLQRPTTKDVLRATNDHFDQGPKLLGLQCVQGSVALTDQEEGDGCFQCWPRSHQFHEQIVTQQGAPNRDFVLLKAHDKDLLKSHDIHASRVYVRRGDVVLWRSDLAHCGAPPVGTRDTFRAVVYVSCLPCELTPEPVYHQKSRAYDQLETGCHWACREEWFSKQDLPGIQPFHLVPPPLTRRQQELYGLVRYPSKAEMSSSESPADPAKEHTVIKKEMAIEEPGVTSSGNDAKDIRRCPGQE